MKRALLHTLLTLTLSGIAHAEQFKPHPKTFNVGPFPTSSAVADLNGDGIPEIITTSRGHLSDLSDEVPAGDELSYLTAETPLEYIARPPIKAGFGPYALQIVNIDALKAKDIVVVNFMATRNRDLTLLRNLGENIFEPINFGISDDELKYVQHLDRDKKPVFTTPGFTAVAVDDFDRDGYRDAVATGWSSDIVAYFPGVIEGYFADPILTKVHGSPRDLVVHDFDRDGQKDLAVLAYRTHEIVLLKGIGYGAFEEVNRFVTRGTLPVSLGLGDLNNDSKQDLIVGHSHADDSIVIFYQEKGFQFPIAQEIQLGEDGNKIEYGIRDIHLTDADNNGTLDIAIACASAQQVIVLINGLKKDAALATFTREVYSFKKGRPYALTAADLNGDQKADLAVALWEEDKVALLLHR